MKLAISMLNAKVGHSSLLAMQDAGSGFQEFIFANRIKRESGVMNMMPVKASNIPFF